MEKHSVRSSFLPPTALKFIRQSPKLPGRSQNTLRSIMSAGEPLGAEILQWAEETLGGKINVRFGQTEVNYCIGICQTMIPAKPGSMGRSYPGHRAAVLDGAGNLLPPGEKGEIAFYAPGDPVVFLKYWNNEKSTQAKYSMDWILSGDEGTMDEDGNFWFSDRTDDVITSSGYRIGPAEIEEQLLKLPAVGLAAVVGHPDELRGHLVKAFVRVNPGFGKNEELKNEFRDYVKSRLAAHEYPRLIEFLDDFLTTNGKGDAEDPA